MKRLLLDLAGRIMRRIVPLALACGLTAVATVCRPDPAGAVTAGKVEITGLSSITRQEFIDMTGIEQGREVDAEIVRSGIKRAFLKGVFDDIQVRVGEGEQPDVSINVVERDMIGRVTVSGDPGVSEKTVSDSFMLREGQIMRYDLVPEAILRLRQSMSRFGYPDARITVDVKKTERPHRIDVAVDIEKGEPIVIKSIELNFKTPLPPEASIPYGLHIGDVYDQTVVEREIEKMRSYLKEERYYKPSVGPYTFHGGDLLIQVDPGSRLDVRFQGNREFSAKDLMKEVPFFEIEDFNPEIVDESVDRMMSLYHEKGYFFARIAPVISSKDRDIAVTFFIFEGERVKVKKISFKGNSLAAERLKGVMTLQEGDVYNPDRLQPDREALKALYGSLGYLDTTVKDIDARIDRAAGAADLSVEIDEGPRSEVGAVELVGAPGDMKEKLASLLVIKPGDPYNEVDVSDARFRLLDYFNNNGYPNADVTAEPKIEDHQVSLVFTVVPGTEEFFGRTVVLGNKETRYVVIRRELAHREGDPYSLRMLAEDRRGLYKTGLFSNVEIETLKAADNRKDIVIRVTEANAGSVEFGVGYGDVERFRGFFQVNYRNLWGMNREGLFRTELSTLEQRLILQYNEPWFWGRSLPLRVFLLYENRKELNVDTKDILYKLKRYGTTAGFEKKLNERVKGEIYYEFSLVETSDVQPDVILTKEDTGSLAISGIKPSLIYDTRDNPFDPKSGIFAGVTLKTATFLLFSETNFVKAEVYASTFRKIAGRVTLAASVRGGMAFGYAHTDELPIVERFFLGGRSTVRGYAQDTLGPKGADGNPTGGNAFLMGNLELRVSVGRGIGVVPFFDTGNVWVKAKDVDPTDLKYTTGLGLRYSTPVGPLRVDYGVKLNREPGESRGEVHFSIGQAF